MIELQSGRAGIILPVRVQPNAKSNGIRGEQAGSLKVSVTQAPEKGKANKALIAVLASELCLRKSQIALVSGATTQHKRFVISDITIDDLTARVRDAMIQAR